MGAHRFPGLPGSGGALLVLGPAAGRSVYEPYDEGSGRLHLVQYFDKSRMEINDVTADRNSKWFVTNGLLTVELVSGRVQFGNTRWLPKTGGPAPIPVASDADDANAPTYASFTNLANTVLGDHGCPTAAARSSRDGEPGGPGGARARQGRLRRALRPLRAGDRA